MKGFAMLEIGKVGWVEKPKPVCGPMDAVCRPLAAAVCTSDVHTVWEGAVGERHDMILGHECCAEVVSVGELVRDFQPGDRVLVPAITPDWSSLEAQAGFAMHSGGMLAGWKFSNIKNGVFSEFFHVNDADGNLAHLPEGMDITEACMLSDMVPTGFHGAELADVQFGDTVLVVGIGPVGLMAVAGAALRGAARILAVGTRPVCVEAARKYGATDFISYKNGPIDEQVLALTGGKGVDCAIIAGGDVDTFNPRRKDPEARRADRQRQLSRQRGLCEDPARGLGRRHGPQADQRRAHARRAAADGEARRAHDERAAGREAAHHPRI